MTATLPARDQIPPKFTWDDTSVFASEDEWEAARLGILSRIPDLEEFAGHLGESASMLADWFEARESVFRIMGKLRLYAYMFNAVDATNQESAARLDRARSTEAKLMAATAFGAPEIIAVGFEKLRQWLAEEPRLTHLGHYLERLERRASHVRSAEVEELLGAVTDPLATALSAHGVLANSDLVFGPARTASGKEEVVAQGTIDALLTSPDRELRRSAWESYADAHLAARNGMAATLAGCVKRDVFIARARRYPDSLTASLEPNHVPVEVFHNLVRVFKANLGTWHRYWRIRRRALGLDSLRPYDLRAELTDEKLEVPYEQAMEWIVEGLRPLGDDYVDTMHHGVFEQRWVDLYPNRGKKMGAFSAGVPGTHPFIFMSYKDDIYSMSTLAHELGHSMHSFYTRGTQPYLYTDYGLFQAEVASNVNQAMTRRYLLETHPDPRFQLAVVQEAMANFYRYFFIMPSLARLELAMHEHVEAGQAVTADYLDSLTADLLCEVFGDQVEVTAEDRRRLGITWAQFHTHLYSNFYVYQYATGISGANHLAERIWNGEPGAAENYRAFLLSGGSMYPMDGLRLAGVDLTSSEPVEAAFATLAGMVDRLEELVQVNARPGA